MNKMRELFLYSIAFCIFGTSSLFAEDSSQPEKEPIDPPSTLESTTVDPEQIDDIYLNPNAVHVILEPLHRATLTSQITSPIISVEKKMGDSIKPGDVLIKLDDVIYRASLKKALATFKQAELTLKTREELFQGDVGSLVELREAQTQFATAEADLAIARKQLEAATITAPYHGRIVDVYVHDFELAEALEPLLDLIGDDVLLARMIIESTMLNRINIGTQIEIYFPDADLKVPAVITRIGAEIDPASSTIRVDAELENVEYRLTSGMSGMTVLPQRKIYNNTIEFEKGPVEIPTSAVEEPLIDPVAAERAAAFKDFIAELDSFDISRINEQKDEDSCDDTGCKLQKHIEQDEPINKVDFEPPESKGEDQTAFENFLKELDQYDLSKFELEPREE